MLHRAIDNSFSAATAADDIAQLAYNVHSLRKCAARGPDGLARLSRSDLKDFSMGVDRLERQQGLGFDVAAGMGPELWEKVIELHAITVRQLFELTTGQQKEQKGVERVEILLGSIMFLFIKTNALKTGSTLGSRLALALIKCNTFQCYARLLSVWEGLPRDDIEAKLRLMAQFSLMFSSCAQLTVSDRPVTPTDQTGTALYEAFLEALSASNFVEHLTRALLRGLIPSQNASTRLLEEQERNIKTGVMETCGCVVSALHGIAGKQGMLDSCWVLRDGEVPTAAVRVARQLLPLARTVLSGPCLQFLLGREIIAARLRITGGVGADFGLRAAAEGAMLPELGVGNPCQTRVLTDRLLSRLGAASLVWHLVLRDRASSTEGVPAAQQKAGPGLPYLPVNLFDTVLESLSSVVDPSTPVEHLPGGSQLTLVEPAMLLVRLTLRLTSKQLQERLGPLWRVLVKLLVRPQVRLQYSEHRPLQLIGGLLRLELDGQGEGEQQSGAAPAAGVVAAAPAANAAQAVDGGAAGTGDCSLNVRSALDAGFLRAVEQLLRGWGRADPTTSKGSETSCLCTVNHLLRWSCAWPAMMAHGSVREVASLVVTIRRLGELFKERGFEFMKRVGSNGPNEHQDAEVVTTAYMVAFLEQQSAVLLRPSGGNPLALNAALESAGVPVLLPAVAQLGGRPPVGSPAAEQQRLLTVFAVSQWLPNALWLARVVDTWFSVDMGKAALRWVLEAGLQCCAARARSEAESAQTEPSCSYSSAASGKTSSSGSNGSGDGTAKIGSGDSSGSSALNAGSEPAAAKPCGPGAVAYVAWVTFLVAGIDMLAWTHKYLVQLRQWQEREAAGVAGRRAQGGGREDGGEEGGKGDGQSGAAEGLCPEALLPSLLDVLEVLTVAMPRSVRMCIVGQGDKPRLDDAAVATGGKAAAAPAATSAVMQAAAGTVLAASAAATAASASAAAAATSASNTQSSKITSTQLPDLQSVTAVGTSGGGVPEEPRPDVVAEAEAAKVAASVAPPPPQLLPATSLTPPQAPLQPPATAQQVPASEAAPTVATLLPQPQLDRRILVDDWLRALLEQQGRQKLLAVLGAWADGGSGGGSGQQGSAGAAPEAPSQGLSPEAETPQLAALREAMWAKHDLAHLAELPSPYAAAEKVEAAGFKTCGNPACNNLEEDSEAKLSRRKTCARCKAVSYCSGKCQLDHWKSQHQTECGGGAQRQQQAAV